MTRRKLRGYVLALACGGVTLQAGGCATQLATALTDQLLNTILPTLITAVLSNALGGAQNDDDTTG